MKADFIRPPRLAKRLLGFMKGYRDHYSIIDDLDQVFKEIIKENGYLRAASWYWYQALGAIPKYITFLITWRVVMFRNYFKVALRNIKRHKVYSFINIFGLAIGITVCILIFIFIEYELGFDSHVADKEHIYRMVAHINNAEGKEYSGCTPFPTAAALRSDFPEMGQSTQVYRDYDAKITVGEDHYRGDIPLFVEFQFFGLFDIEWIQGTASQTWDDPFAVILTERLADKYFRDTDVIGKVLRLNDEYDLRVAGVVSNPPRKTSLPYDMLISWKTLEAYWDGERLDQWDLFDGASFTFTLLPESVDTQVLENRFESLEQKYMEPDYAERWSMRLQPLGDIHFNPRFGSYNYVTSRKVLLGFSAIGLLILVIACINFINLTTAQAMKRTREIGMRKVLGARRAQLIRQLLGETGWFTLISILLALFTAQIILPYLDRFLGNNSELRIFSSGEIFIFLGIVYLLVSGFSGLYPAFALTRHQPGEALKERLPHRGKRSYAFRNSLVLFQFLISQILIVGTLVIAGQMKFMSDRNLGFRSENILLVPIPAYEESRCETLRSQWMQDPGIREVSFAWTAPTSRSDFQTRLKYEASGNAVEFPVYIKMSDKRYLDTYEIPLVAGRFFARNVNDESDVQWVVSMSVARRMGLSDPQEAVGRSIVVNDLKGPIIGVTGDFHGMSLRSEIQPIVFFNFWPRNFREAQILLDMNDVRGVIAHIQEAWTEFYPDNIFQYEFFDDLINGLYRTDSKFMILIQAASFLSILIGCLGLLGLVSFMVLQRSKEIGIRKVLGATVASVYFMVSKEFLKWVVIANIVAWPMAFYFAHEWLQGFAYRIPLGVDYFLISGSISLGIAALVMSYQVMRAAAANPVDSLQYE
jgi:putative ABC transport system permease protein